MLAPRITPVILSGGGGTRLWPLSRTQYPKQYWTLTDGKTLLQESVLRVTNTGHANSVSNLISFHDPLIICNNEHRFVVAEQLRQINITSAQIILEMEPRNTAFAITIACLLQKQVDNTLLILPSDHVIQNTSAFLEAIASAAISALEGNIVTFGIMPNRAETRYGYIKKGPLKHETNKGCTNYPVFSVEQFIEKPDLNTAEEFLRDENCFWNSGIFLFKVQTMLHEIERLCPSILEECRLVLSSAKEEPDFLRLGIPKTYYAQLNASDPVPNKNAPLVSIDHAVMENTPLATVIPVDMGWSDVGTWDALWEISAKDPNGNVIVGDVITQNVRNSYLRSDHHLLSTIGLENIVVISTNDAVLVAHQDYVQQVKDLVEQLKKENRKELVTHTRVYRPWGYYQTIDLGDRFQVKRLMVKPGEKTSIQIHYHRSERWVVVEGMALVTRGEETHLIHEDGSIYLPRGIKHRVENPEKLPLHLIEIQAGSYLGEDDIVRVMDAYGRAEASSPSIPITNGNANKE